MFSTSLLESLVKGNRILEPKFQGSEENEIVLQFITKTNEKIKFKKIKIWRSKILHRPVVHERIMLLDPQKNESKMKN